MPETETDIDDILMDLPSNGGGRGGNGEGGGDAESNNGRMLGRSEERPLKRADNILDLAKNVRSNWIPYCNDVCLSPSGASYLEFSKLYRKSSSLPSELANGMKICGDIREGAIRAFLKVREMLPDFRFFNDPLDKLITDIVNVEGNRYRGSKDKQVALFREIKAELDGMGEDADGLMFGDKEEIVSWWRGTLGSACNFYEERNWGYAFYLMCALCDDNGEADPVARTLLEAIESSYKDSPELRSLWENMFVFLLLVFGMVLDTPIATGNVMFRKFGKNVLHTKVKLSKKGGKNSLNSLNGLRVLSCASKAAFFLDVAAKQNGFIKTIGRDPNVQKTTKLVKDRKFEEVGKEPADDVYLWLFWHVSKDYRLRELAVHLGLDVMFYVCMCISTSDNNGNQEHLCRYEAPVDNAKDKKDCVLERYAKSRSFGMSSLKAAEEMGQRLVEQIKRLASLLEDTFGLPEEKRDEHNVKRQEIFTEMEKMCPVNGRNSTIAWNATELPMGFVVQRDAFLITGSNTQLKRAGKNVKKENMEAQVETDDESDAVDQEGEGEDDEDEDEDDDDHPVEEEEGVPGKGGPSGSAAKRTGKASKRKIPSSSRKSTRAPSGRGSAGPPKKRKSNSPVKLSAAGRNRKTTH